MTAMVTLQAPTTFRTAERIDGPGVEDREVRARNLRIHAMLSSKFSLPLEISQKILDGPENWIQTELLMVEPTTDRFNGRSPSRQISPFRVSDGSEVIIGTAPLDLHQLNSLRKIVVSFKSKDQGWSSYPTDHGTYNGSYSWWEIRLLRSVETFNAETGDTRVELMMAASPRAMAELRDEWKTVCTCHLQNNRHAGRGMESYTVGLDHGSDILQSMRVGDRMVLFACARFPGWCNYVQSASMELWCRDRIEHSI